jgi:two-component system phosphate regulon response regulator OmpR
VNKRLRGFRWLAAGELVVDRKERQALVKGRALPLTPRSLGVLEFLMLHSGEIIGRERLMDAVWGWPRAAGPRAADVRIAEVRRALRDDRAQPRYIQTVAGEGYAFVAEVWGQE